MSLKTAQRDEIRWQFLRRNPSYITEYKWLLSQPEGEHLEGHIDALKLRWRISDLIAPDEASLPQGVTIGGSHALTIHLHKGHKPLRWDLINENIRLAAIRLLESEGHIGILLFDLNTITVDACRDAVRSIRKKAKFRNQPSIKVSRKDVDTYLKILDLKTEKKGARAITLALFGDRIL